MWVSFHSVVILDFFVFQFFFILFFYGGNTNHSLFNAGFSSGALSHTFAVPLDLKHLSQQHLCSEQGKRWRASSEADAKTLLAWAAAEWLSNLSCSMTWLLSWNLPQPQEVQGQHSVQKQKPWFCWSVCLPHSRKCWWEGNHPRSTGQIVPFVILRSDCNSYCIIQGRKRTFFLNSCILSFIKLFSVCIQA